MSYDTILIYRGTKQHTYIIHSSPGTGAVYSFDPVGSYERETCRAAGAAQSLVQPFLDNQVSSRFIQTYGRSNQDVYTNRRVSSLITQYPTLFLFCVLFTSV